MKILRSDRFACQAGEGCVKDFSVLSSHVIQSYRRLVNSGNSSPVPGLWVQIQCEMNVC